MSNVKEDIQVAMEKLGKDYSPEVKQSFENLLTNIFEKGMLPKDAMGMSDALVEGIYAHAYRLYNSGKYKEASQLFRLLIMLNPTESKYPLGLAACFHMVKEYANAAAAYSVVSLVDPKTPMPYYHSSDCFIQLGEWALAKVALEKVIELSGNQEQYAMVKDRSIFTLASVKHELEIAQQPNVAVKNG